MTIETTPEHPFHVEDWDGKVETVVASLNGTNGLPAHMLVPSDGGTQYGDWVKGGALNTTLGTFDYGYDVKGNITGIGESGTPTRTRTYTLDAIERLTAVADGGGAALESYTLDEEGNRIASHREGYHVSDPANRLTEDESHVYEYDVNGNQVRRTVKATGETWRYAYSVFDELAQATRHDSADPAAPATLTKSWTYDPLGRRRTENGPSGGRVFHYDGEHVVMEWTGVGLNSTNI